MRTITFSLSLLIAAMPVAGVDGPRLLDGTISPPTAKQTQASIRVNVDMALVPVTVLDTMGHNVLGLSRGNFRVFDGPEQRPIVSFGTQDAPVTVGLIFDCSRSMVEKFKTAREAPMELYKQLNPEDETFLITVSDRATLRQPLTSSFEDIESALMFTNPNGSTSLIDGVFLGLSELKKAHNPRKALVVVSDGGDNNSRYSLRELSKIAAEADVQIFTICLFAHPQTREEAEGPVLLSDLVRNTGGVNYLTADVNDLRNAMGRIGVTLHNEYVLGYYPPEGAAPGKYRKIKVQLLLPANLPRLQVFARSSYFLPER